MFNSLVLGQNEASYWYFGQNAGLRFNAETGTVAALTNGALNTLEGCTSISDANGNLLFYSDGSTVWNRNHQVMLNGLGLRGDDSSTSSGVIVPKPQDPDFYYIFTVDEPHHDNSSAFPNNSANDGINDGLMYSRVNINDDNGLGAVDNVEKNIPLITYDPAIPIQNDFKCSEKITAVGANDCSSIWVVTHFGDKFYAFKVDANGVNTTPVISTVGPYIPYEGYRRNALGYLKASPDGSKLLVAHYGEATLLATNAPGSVWLFDFNNDTGEVTNSLELYSAQNNNSPYGVEFSAENRKAYATVGGGPSGTNGSQILQWDLESADIPNSLQIIHSSTALSAGALQLGIDRRIYRAQVDFSNFNNSGRHLGVISNPEESGLGANYIEQGILLDITGTSQNLSRIGLPPFIQSLFNSQIDIIRNGESTTELRLCTGDTYTLMADDIPGADYVWTRDGNPLAETGFELFIDTPGFYEVFIEPNNGECPIEGSAVVGIFEIPVANPLTDIIFCDDQGNDAQATFDFTSKNTETLLTQDPNQFNVSYYEDLTDANTKENPIVFPFVNSSNPQTIYVRVDNLDNDNCFDINSFQVEVFDTPEVQQTNVIEFCDNLGDITDGIAEVDFNDIIPLIRGNQSDTETAVSFHLSQDDADNNASALPLLYTNSGAANETIYVRIENTLNSDCYSTANFPLVINNAPVANNVSLFQCDEDGIPDGFTVFNLAEIENDIIESAPNISVQFYPTQFDADTNSNPVNALNFQNFLNPQTLIAKATNDITGCSNTSEVLLEVSATATNDASLGECDYDGTEDGFTIFNLTDANETILAGAPDGLDISYYETYEDALLETNALNSNYTNIQAYTQIIFARVENANACYGISEIELTVFELPNLETEFETLYCLNFFPQPIVLEGGVIDDIPNNYLYEWSTGETTTQIEVNAPGIYTVLVTNTNGCSKLRTITVEPSNIASVTGVEIIDATENNSVTVFVSGEGDYEYAIQSISGPYQDSNTFENLSPGLYTVYIRDRNNCGIAEEDVSVIGFPKYFTPNGDGINEFWQIKGVSEQFQPNSEILIFDRYGKLLKQLSPLGPGWDGTYNGAKMPTDDYWFSITLQDGRTFTSHFTLKR